MSSFMLNGSAACMHDQIDDKVCVNESWIPGAGYGLFACKKVMYGETVCIYWGKRLSTSEALKLSDKSYLMRLGEQVYIDALECVGKDLSVSISSPDNTTLLSNSSTIIDNTAFGVARIPESSNACINICLARYINDCRNPLLYNVQFKKDPEHGIAYVVAIRDIEPGEELFVDYGKWYWLSLNPVRLNFNAAQEKKKLLVTNR